MQYLHEKTHRRVLWMRRRNQAASVLMLGTCGLVTRRVVRVAVADGIRVLPRATETFGRAHRTAPHGRQLAAASDS